MQSESIAALTKALSVAQCEYNTLIKDSANPFFKSKYADLAACIDSVRTSLSKHGLAVIQTTDTRDDKIILITTLAHESGEWIRGTYLVDPVKKDPQGYGAAMTYARRYCLQAILGIAADDDDGESASGRGNIKGNNKPHVATETPPASPNAEPLPPAPGPLPASDNVVMRGEITLVTLPLSDAKWQVAKVEIMQDGQKTSIGTFNKNIFTKLQPHIGCMCDFACKKTAKGNYTFETFAVVSGEPLPF